MSPSAVVAVVGGGASGVLTAAHVAMAAAAAGRPLELLLIEPAEVGRGVAYSTRDPRHRMNVRAAGLSALPGDPEHFVRWLRDHVDPDFPSSGFAARMHYGDYLAFALDECVRAAPGVHLEVVPGRATDLRQQGRRLRLSLEDGTRRAVDAAVLAIGPGSASTLWAPAELLRSPRFIADPWAAIHPAATGVAASAGGPVVFVGAGLTMADMAISYGAGPDDQRPRMHSVSRHGLLPLAHVDAPLDCIDPPPLPGDRPPVTQPPVGHAALKSAAPKDTADTAADPERGADGLSLAQVRRLVFAQVRSAQADGGDWRAAIDSLRPVTAQLWARLAPEARTGFVTHAVRRWDRVRHRVEPSIGAWLEDRLADGSLSVHAGSILAATDTGDALHLQLSGGQRIKAGLVVNCTGADGDVRRSDNPLVMNLLESGLARPERLGLGFATDDSGRLVTAASTQPAASAQPAVWTLGALRRGQLWESTAIPEIRAQAVAIADALVAALPEPRVRRRPRDPYGLPLSTTPAAAQCYVNGLGRILRVQSGAENLVAQAVRIDPSFAVGHAALALLGAEWSAPVDVAASLAAAQRHADHVDAREARFIQVVTERVNNPGARSAATLLSYVNDYPEDALAASIAVPTIAFAGATEVPAEAWAVVESLAPAYGDDWWYGGMLAFIRQEQGRYDEAAELADRALAKQPAAGHAVHARTHVYYETGRHAAGLAWLDSWIDQCGRDAAHRAHFSWHAGLHELALGDDQAAARRYRDQLAPPHVSGIRALVDSASLLWRGHANGAWTLDAMHDIIAVLPPELLIDPPTPFVAMHSAVALAAAGDCRRLAQLRRSAAARPDDVFTGTVAPLADALVDLVHGDVERATDELNALAGVARLGGSAAQREVIEETLLFAAISAQRVELARSILTERLDRRASPRDTARLEQANHPALPDAHPALPDARPALPDARPALPDARPTGPDSSATVPGLSGRDELATALVRRPEQSTPPRRLR